MSALSRLLLGLLAWTALAAEPAAAYPNYVSFGYKSCLTCHYNPYGGGPLTDYGRALSATEIADRIGWKPEATEDEIADKSAFLGAPSGPAWLRPAFNVRTLTLRRDIGKENQKNDFIVMDLSGSLVAKFLNKDRLIFVGQIGYAPKPQAQKDADDVKLYRSREHYVGYRLNKEIGVYAGLMDKVFGIRVPDHIAFSRMVTGLTQNDQTDGVLFHYATDFFEVGIQPFIGNLVQDKDLRQKGVTSQVEFTLSDTARAGASVLSSQSDYLNEFMYSTHGRVGIGKGNSILAEVGEVDRTPKTSGAETLRSQYVFTQTHLRARRGLWALLSVEALKADKDVDAKTVRIGPGVQFFPFQRLEVRTDAYHTESSSPGTDTTKTWDLTAQMHVWL